MPGQRHQTIFDGNTNHGWPLPPVRRAEIQDVLRPWTAASLRRSEATGVAPGSLWELNMIGNIVLNQTLIQFF